MPRKCTVCEHPSRAEIDAALVAGKPYRRVATQFDAGPESVRRHKAHVTTAMVKAAHAEEVALVRAGGTLIERLRNVADRVDRITSAAERVNDVRVALVGLRELREAVKMLLEIEAEAGKGAGLDSPDFRQHLERLGDASERMCEPCHALLVAALGGQG